LTLPTDALERYELFRRDPWAFLCHCVYTLDEVDQAQPVKPYPSHFEYARFITLMWQHHKKMAIPKSRRMTVSWTCLALIVHDAIFHKGRSWAVTSKKEEDARELVSRCEFIMNHIPADKIAPELLPKMKRGGMQSSPPVIEFEQLNSRIQGFPQGGNQLRQRGFSGIFEDECAFQEESEATYAAAEPTIRGGGRFIKVSSRAIEDGGFFKKIVFDQLDSADTRFPEVPPVPVKTPMEGVTVWKNPRNEFLVIDLHYTANPAKRGPEFREGLRRTLPIRRFRMEYEKSWETFEGKPVYEDFNEGIHLTRTKPSFLPMLPLLIGWDSSGLTPAAVLGQLQGEQLVVFREVIGTGMGSLRFCPLVSETIKLNYPSLPDVTDYTINFFDPAAFKKNEITEQTYLQTLNQAGFRRCFPGPMTWNKRVDAVTRRLTGLFQGKPKILIYEPDCPTLVAGFKGGFRYPDSYADAEQDKPRPIKDAHSHPHDALQYLCGGLEASGSGSALDIPTPTYGFQRIEEKHGRSFR